ncbi:hypothetical protein RHMOL_Rhmol01G0177100 [Rhododendron molle]|uniref:Uncharacterized protein n=1 Tax=Rhododendron molle TaxID=49168 RepID=A0ACC0Q2H8_RHOML|nr:hypothetical protein RHMOL_Rhmol01G0177100 [Rhododendron molle]
MSTLDVARAELGLVVLYLNKAEARDKICRAIQYGSKYLSNGEPGTAQNVDKSTSLARKVFRLFKFVNDLHALISPTPPGTPLPLVLLGKEKERAEVIGRISLYCWMGSSICSTLVEAAELGRLSVSMNKLEKDLKDLDKYKNEQYRSKLKKSNERSLALVKAAMDIVVAVGLLQLAPKKVNARVTGAFGFVSSLISCYQVMLTRAQVILESVASITSTPEDQGTLKGGCSYVQQILNAI